MNEDLFETVFVPVAEPADARQTADAVEPYVGAETELLVAHVVPKGGGVPDKASVEQREQYAEEAYQAFRDRLAPGVGMTPVTLYGRDVGETIVDGALEADATVIAYTPREVSRWAELLTETVSDDVLENGEVPVLVLPETGD
jgi:nucleotide-binding universal stress UspA family protein